ncbi:MAG: hypothetical protein LBJ35_05260 [Spirochaetaceae bacterium]|nr:hypothetical protein [Spirochaetaceae bacterium]
MVCVLPVGEAVGLCLTDGCCGVYEGAAGFVLVELVELDERGWDPLALLLLAGGRAAGPVEAGGRTTGGELVCVRAVPAVLVPLEEFAALCVTARLVAGTG